MNRELPKHEHPHDALQQAPARSTLFFRGVAHRSLTAGSCLMLVPALVGRVPDPVCSPGSTFLMWGHARTSSFPGLVPMQWTVAVNRARGGDRASLPPLGDTCSPSRASRSSPPPGGGGSARGEPVGSRAGCHRWSTGVARIRFFPKPVPMQWTVVAIAPGGSADGEGGKSPSSVSPGSDTYNSPPPGPREGQCVGIDDGPEGQAEFEADRCET